MRKIEEAMCAAVKERRNWESGNTRVKVHDGGNWVKVFLHGNLIYTDCQESGERSFTLAGYDTQTARNRCRALGADTKVMRRDKNAWFNF